MLIERIGYAIGYGTTAAVLFFPITYFAMKSKYQLKPLIKQWLSFVLCCVLLSLINFIGIDKASSSLSWVGIMTFLFLPIIVSAAVLKYTGGDSSLPSLTPPAQLNIAGQTPESSGSFVVKTTGASIPDIAEQYIVEQNPLSDIAHDSSHGKEIIHGSLADLPAFAVDEASIYAAIATELETSTMVEREKGMNVLKHKWYHNIFLIKHKTRILIALTIAFIVLILPITHEVNLASEEWNTANNNYKKWNKLTEGLCVRLYRGSLTPGEALKEYGATFPKCDQPLNQRNKTINGFDNVFETAVREECDDLHKEGGEFRYVEKYLDCNKPDKQPDPLFYKILTKCAPMSFPFVIIMMVVFIILTACNLYFTESNIGWKRISIVSAIALQIFCLSGEAMFDNSIFFEFSKIGIILVVCGLFPATLFIILGSKSLFNWIREGFRG